jgi:hypothetical protein
MIAETVSERIVEHLRGSKKPQTVADLRRAVGGSYSRILEIALGLALEGRIKATPLERGYIFESVEAA